MMTFLNWYATRSKRQIGHDPIKQNTVKLVRNDHHWDPKIVAVVDWRSFRCSEVHLFFTFGKRDSKIVVDVDRGSLFGGGR
jgi:hypothetical protein